jgi:hypothetical protein
VRRPGARQVADWAKGNTRGVRSELFRGRPEHTNSIIRDSPSLASAVNGVWFLKSRDHPPTGAIAQTNILVKSESAFTGTRQQGFSLISAHMDVGRPERVHFFAN